MGEKRITKGSKDVHVEDMQGEGEKLMNECNGQVDSRHRSPGASVDA